MALKTPELQEEGSAALSEQEQDDFFERLDKFRESLSDREQIMLAVLVVEATDEADEIASNGQPEQEPPTEAELDAFAEKLSKFHDSLPGNQHLMLDTMLGKSWFQHEAEVEGYYWVPIDRRRITNSQWGTYAYACNSAGGRATWAKWRGSGHRNVACWVWR